MDLRPLFFNFRNSYRVYFDSISSIESKRYSRRGILSLGNSQTLVDDKSGVNGGSGMIGVEFWQNITN